jgi:hypothetical protein
MWFFTINMESITIFIVIGLSVVPTPRTQTNYWKTWKITGIRTCINNIMKKHEHEGEKDYITKLWLNYN